MKHIRTMAATLAVASLGSGQALAAGDLYLYNWTDYTSPQLIEKFEAETGINVTLDTYDSNETLLSRLQAGGAQYDIVVPSQNFVPILIEEGLAYEINAQELDGYENLTDEWRDPEWDPGNRYSIPWHMGSTSFAVNTARYGGDIDTYEVLFHPPEELQGRIGMFGSPDEVVSLAQIYLGLDQCNEDPHEMQQVLELLQEQRPHVQVYDADGILERLASEDAFMHMIWNGYALRTRQENPDIRYAFPREGVLSFADSLMVPAGARNQENAIRFLEFMMQPENAAIQSNFAGYSNGIAGSDAYMDEDLAEAPELLGVDIDDRVFAEVCSEDAIRLQTEVWTRLLQ